MFDKAHNRDGHLGRASRTIRRTVCGRWRTEFKLARRANRLAHRIRAEARVDGENVCEVVSISLLTRIIDDFQSVIILCREGLTVQGGVLLRAILEGAVLMRNLSEDEDFLGQYVGSDLLDRLKLVRLAQTDESGAFEGVKPSALPTIQIELEAAIEAEGIKSRTKEQLFRDVGLTPVYQSAYRVLSGDVHISVRALARYVHFDDSGNIASTDATPKTEDTESILVLSILVLMVALDSSASLLSLPQFEAEIESLNADAAEWSKRERQ